MKFEIRNQDEHDERPTQLELKSVDGGVDLVAHGPHGEYWYVLQITDEGRIKRYADVEDSLGFDLDSEGYVKTENELEPLVEALR